jgi:hypothetical protein
VATLRTTHGGMGLIQHVDTCRLRPLMVAIDIADRDVDPGPAAVTAVQLLGALGLDQHHPVTMHERRVVDLLDAALIIEDAGLKAEGVRQPREPPFRSR